MSALGTGTGTAVTRADRDMQSPDELGRGARVDGANRGRRGGRWVHVALVSAAVVTAFPFYIMVVISLSKPGPVVLPDSLFPSEPELESYRDLLRNGEILRWAFNSMVYSVVSVVLVLWLASMAGYAFAKKRFFGKEVMFWTFIAMLMVPYHLTLIPQFILVSEIGGLNTYWGLILPTLANAQAMFLMRQFIQGVPDELIEAARIDGAGEFRVYWQIVLPQTKPIMATLGVFVFLWHWNDFLWPLVAANSPDMFVMTVGLVSTQEQETALSSIMATATLTFIPTLLVYLLLQRYFVRGVMLTGMKG